MSAQPFISFGGCCLEGDLIPGTPRGKLIQPHGDFAIDYYLVESTPTTPDAPKVAVVMFHDIFGLQGNIPIIADTLCDQLASACNNSQRISVFVPHIIPGDPIPMTLMGPLVSNVPKTLDKDPNGPTKSGLLAKIWAVVGLLPYIPKYWSIRGAVMLPRCEAFLKAVRREGYAKIGAAGYCFGGTQIISLLGQPEAVPPQYSSDPSATYKPLMDCAMIAHPGPASMDNVRKCRIPTTWVCAEEDFSFAEDKRNEAEALLKTNEQEHGIPYEMRAYDNTVHGFAARPALAYPEVVEAFQESGKQTRDWFVKYLL